MDWSLEAIAEGRIVKKILCSIPNYKENKGRPMKNEATGNNLKLKAQNWK